MRTALALVGLICGAASALAWPTDTPFCSTAFDKPAKLVFNSEGQVMVTIGDKITTYSAHEPLGGPPDDKIYGLVVVEGQDGGAINSTATDVYTINIGETAVVIFKDRVFWPCE